MPQGTFQIQGFRSATGLVSQLQLGYSVLVQSPTAVTSLLFNPLVLPDWVDVSRQIDIRFHIFSGGDPTVPGHAIVYTLRYVIVRDDQVGVGLTGTMTWAPPTVWPVLQSKRLIFIDDTLFPAPLFPAHTFERGDSVGFLLTRVGNTAGDNYTLSSYLATFLELIAYKRCQFPCC